MENIIQLIERFIWGLPLIVILIFCHLFFTIKLHFPQFRIFQAVKSIIKKDSNNSSNNSSYKTMMATLAGTLGTGNIIGVATAICIGGIGTVFWIFVSGFFAIATKYAETYIVLKYRKKDKKGKFYGGAMYVLKERLGNNKMALFFSIFVIITSFGIGSMIQSSSAATSIASSFNLNIKWVSVFITVFSAIVLFGNVKKIANVSSILVPISSILYIFMCIGILYMYRANFVYTIINILKNALNINSLASGIGIIYFLNMISVGLSRGMFSNEAGIGSSPMFDITSSEENINIQSKIAGLSVFIDTVIICSLTGIVIAITNNHFYVDSPMELVISVFSKFPFGDMLLSISLSIFAISTIPCWSYYGSVAVNFLFKNKTIYLLLYKLIYVATIYVGCKFQMTYIWSISSISNALMTIPNVYMIIMLNKEIIDESSHKFFTKMK